MMAGAVTLVASTPANAQDSSPVQDAPRQPAASSYVEAGSGDIVVIGYRASLARAAQLKRESAVVSDGIAAEDIGRFPDQNLAESLQRITGIQITRSRGEGAAINIRGLDSNFARTQFNGRTLGTGGNRSFDFANIASSFVSSVQVYKSPTADLIEGGLAGTVDVRTARPLDIGRTTVSMRTRGVYESNRDRVTPRFDGLVNYVTKDKTFGLMLGIAYDQRKSRVYEIGGYGAELGREAQRDPPIDYDVGGDLNDALNFDHATAYRNTPIDRRKFNFVAGFQARPNDRFEFYGDLFVSEFKDRTKTQANEYRFTNIAPARHGDPYGIVSSRLDTSFLDRLVSGSQGFVTDIDADGVDNRSNANAARSDISIGSGALGFKLTSGQFHLTVEGTYSETVGKTATFSWANISRASLVRTTPEGYGAPPLVEFVRGYDPLDPSTYYTNSLSLGSGRQGDTNQDIRADLSYAPESSFLSRLQAGIYYGDRHFLNQSFQASPSASVISEASSGRLPLLPEVEGANGSVASAPYLTEVGMGHVPNAPASLLVPDYDKFVSLVSLDRLAELAPPKLSSASLQDIRERTLAGYGMVDLQSDENRLSANLGVRYVRTNQLSRGFSPDLTSNLILPGNTLTPTSRSRAVAIKSKYAYFLPSANIRYKLTDQLLARVAVARALGRASLNNIGAGASTNANLRTISSGNPNLKPYLSDQADLSFEYYLPKGGVISLAAFYKRISNYVVSLSEPRTYIIQNIDGGMREITYNYTVPANLDGVVRLKGLEFGAQMPFRFLPSPFDGFGIVTSATYIDRPRLRIQSDSQPITLPGVSKFAYTAGAYYEKGGFGLRGSYTYRTGFTQTRGNNFGDFLIADSYGQLDMSASAKITKSVGLVVDVTNLSNAKAKSENNFGLFRGLTDVGRRITAGVNAKF